MKKTTIINFIALIIIWLALIFYFSSQGKVDTDNVTNITKTKFVNIVHYISKGEIELQPSTYQIRKLAHIFNFMILELIIWVFIYKLTRNIKKTLFFSMSLCICYAFLDEFHQMFIPKRNAKISDVFIDTFAALSISFILTICIKYRKIKISRQMICESERK